MALSFWSKLFVVLAVAALCAASGASQNEGDMDHVVLRRAASSKGGRRSRGGHGGRAPRMNTKGKGEDEEKKPTGMKPRRRGRKPAARMSMVRDADKDTEPPMGAGRGRGGGRKHREQRGSKRHNGKGTVRSETSVPPRRRHRRQQGNDKRPSDKKDRK